MKSRVSIKVQAPLDYEQPTTTSLGNSCMEIACTGTLSVTDATCAVTRGTVKWSVDNETVISVDQPSADGTQTITGRGFGRVIITATVQDCEEAPVPLVLYVGSALILGADGNNWQVYPDGSITIIQNKALHKHVKILRASNAVLADLNGVSPGGPLENEPPSEAVTCYVLNLASFTFEKPKKQ